MKHLCAGTRARVQIPSTHVKPGVTHVCNFHTGVGEEARQGEPGGSLASQSISTPTEIFHEEMAQLVLYFGSSYCGPFIWTGYGPLLRDTNAGAQGKNLRPRQCPACWPASRLMVGSFPVQPIHSPLCSGVALSRVC